MLYEIVYKGIEENEKYENIIKEVLKECFREENIQESGLYITVTLTNPDYIKEINAQYRGIDKATDVLSFPMFEKDELEQKIQKKRFFARRSFRRYRDFYSKGRRTSC